MKIYLAGSISGGSYNDVSSSFQNRVDFLRKLGVYQVLHPLLGKEYLRTETVLKAGGYSNPLSTNHAIYNRDKWCVQQADIVWANLLGATTRASIGTAMEMAWASMLGKLVILTIDSDVPNVHQHAFILEASSIIFNSMEESYNYFAVLAESLK